MASFPICPLINQNCFLGITDDCTPGCMIVSLGKKIIFRFRLSDQKQLSLWATKDKFSTPVYYDPDREEYFGVYNGEMISQWSKDKKKITSLGKYKLPWIIHSVHCLPGIRPVLLFRSGNLAFLGTEKKKSITVIKSGVLPMDEILETKAFAFSGHHYLCFLVKKNDTIILNFVTISESNELSFEIVMVRKESTSTLSCFTVLEDKGRLMTLWSDGCLYSFDLDVTSKKNDDFPGRCITTFTIINCTLPCMMLGLENNHVAVYGADSNGEGAKVVWVETSFGVIHNSLHLKLYCNPPRMWNIGTSYLITPVGQYLTVIPYQLKNIPKLDSVLAAQPPTDSNVTAVSWEKLDQSDESHHSKLKLEGLKRSNVDQTVNDEKTEGFPEYLLSQQVTSSLIEEGKVREALSNLSNFSDIPDKCIVDAVISCLNLDKTGKNSLILQALKFPLLNSNETLSYIREQLSFESVTSLMDILSNQLENEPGNHNIVNWLIMLLDAHYQEYLLTKDEAVQKQLLSLKEQIDSEVSNMLELQNFYKLLTGSLKTKVSSKSVVQYSVDKFRLY